MTFKKVAVIGFGEAGPVFAEGFKKNGIEQVSAFDILIDDESSRPKQEKKARAIGVEAAYTRSDAVAGAELILSTVTADRAVEAAVQVAPFLQAGQIYLDINSSSPRQKKEAAAAVTSAGAVFVEGVAMDTVPLKGFQTPLLLAGPEVDNLAEKLVALTMVAEAVGPDYGQACSVKLIRSVIIKGLEALFAESMTAAGKIGVQDRVIDTLYVTFPGLDWRKVAGYHLSRLAVHGRRRAAEMRASAETIGDIGVDPIMAKAIAERHQWGVDLGLAEVFDESAEPTIDDFIVAVKKTGAFE